MLHWPAKLVAQRFLEVVIEPGQIEREDLRGLHLLSLASTVGVRVGRTSRVGARASLVSTRAPVEHASRHLGLL